MPTHFSSLVEEAQACRTAAILFDGHAMGELLISGKDALKAVQKLCVNDLAKLTPGMMAYTSLCTEEGGIFDDLVVFCVGENQYLLTMAAFNTHKTPGWVEKHTAGMNICIADQSAGTTCIEIQGPKSRQIMQKIAEFDCSDKALPYYRIRERQDRWGRLHGRAAWSDGRARLRDLLRSWPRLADVRRVCERWKR